ncbi:MAG: nucleoside-diphosphate kinase [Treponema sp.]|nr:nucleoside-diphosphate kinase [Treponema sp.]
MSESLSYVLVTPYTIAKSRTGGVLSRLLSRTNLELVGAQMFTPDKTFVKEYAKKLRKRAPSKQLMLLPDYVEQNLAPSGGRPHRSLLLLFRGEEPCKQLSNVCGHLYTQHVEVDALQGETIRDTYADLIFSHTNPDEVTYFEPAVLTPRDQDEANEELLQIANFLEGKGNVIQNVTYPDPSKIEQTLAMIKPDILANNSSHLGTIIDMFSRTGLRIIGIKIHRFSLAEAIAFYGSVEPKLIEKHARTFGMRAKKLLETEFEFKLSKEALRILMDNIGIECAKDQFAQLVEYMCGKRPGHYSKKQLNQATGRKCMVLVYEGENAIQKIRDVLGHTDPRQASTGTVRKDFGISIMKNSAHGSDSTESFEREKEVIRTNENSLRTIIKEHLSIKI